MRTGFISYGMQAGPRTRRRRLRVPQYPLMGGKAGTRVLVAVLALLAGAVLVAAARWPSLAGVLGSLARDARSGGPFIFSNLGWSLACAVLAAVLLLMADSTGGALCAFWTGRRPEGRARLVALFPGWYAPAFSLMALAAVRLWYPPLVAAAALAPALAFLPRRRGLRASATGRVPWSAIAAAVLLLVPVLLSLSPELNMDCLRYHLALPEHMLRRHGLIGDPVPLGWSITAAADLPNVLVQLAGLDGAARLVRPFLALAGALALAMTLAGPGFSLRALLLPALVALIVPVESWQVMATAKNDAVVCGTMLAAAAVLLGGAPERRPFRHGPPGAERPDHAGAGALTAGGLLLGLGFAAKAVTAGLSAALVAAVLLRRAPGRRAGGAAWLLAGACGAVIPWVALSFLQRGDPFYPAGILVFPGLFAGSTDADSFRRAYEGFLYRTRRLAEWPGVLGGLTLRNSFPALAALPLLMMREHRSRLAAVVAGLGGLLLIMFQLPGFYFSERFGYPAQAVMNIAALVALATAGGRTYAPAILGVAATLRLAVALLGANGEVTPMAFHSGRLSAAGYVRAGTGAYGAVLEAVGDAVAPMDGVIVSGETLTAGLPGRVLSSGYGPPPVWQAAAESATAERMAVRLRQWRTRWIIHNLPLALIERYQATAWRWNRRSLVLLHRFTRERLEVRAWSGRSDPGFGSDWLIEVLSRPRPVPGLVVFLPGMESVYSGPAMSALAGHTADAVSQLKAIRKAIPGVALTDSLLANVLAAQERYGEAYPLARGSVRAGLVDETNVLDWMVAAAKTGRRAEAEKAMARAKEVYPLWPGRIEEARKKMMNEE